MGQHKKAHELMAFNSFRNVSWRPDIELALLTALHYENYDEYPINDALKSDLLHNTNGAHYNFSPPHQLFKLLGSLFQDSKTKLSEADVLLLKSDYIYPLIFLTAGWHEAGLELKDPGVIPANLPSWVPFTYTQSIKVLKGNQAALDFALKQTRTPELTLLIGEMQIALGQDNEGVQELESLSKEETPVGFKAAWSLAVLAIEKNELEKAQSLINENAQLKNHPVGKELLAQIYLKQGKKDEARSIYREIEDKSYEAKSYQASAYLEEGNLEKAKTLYEALLREFPGNPDFQANYQLILKELQKEK
jgi:tetratricopeptide (TPR) repeat protein